MQEGDRSVPFENRALDTPENAAYLLALVQTQGLTPPSIRRIVSSYGTPRSLVEAPEDQLRQAFGDKVCAAIQRLRASWEHVLDEARVRVDQHLRAGIKVIALNDPTFPPLLKLINDPPPVLFVKGSVSVLADSKALAVVGTRNPTPLGGKVVRQIGRDFAKEGFVIISGLAKGIDSDAHEGALVAGGKTVAVLANSLDHIYPKENRPLASRILESEGALISETPLGTRTFRSGFVQRDRIQSGMSLAIIAVQTDIEGGTMHTVRFAEEQHRLVFCPRPIPEENGMKQYAGIKLLLESGRAEAFGKDEYSRVVTSLLKKWSELTCATESDRPVEETAGHDSAKTSQDQAQKHLQLVNEVVLVFKKSEIQGKKEFEKIISEVKRTLFPSKQSALKKKRSKEGSLFSDN